MAELDNKIRQTNPGKQATVVKSIFVCLILRKEVTNDNEDDASDDAANDDDDDWRLTIGRVLPYNHNIICCCILPICISPDS